jgi:superfamily II DNA or RNA helicase/HKD family nuclease
MTAPGVGLYERLVREDEWEALQVLEAQGRAWIEVPGDEQRRQLLLEEFLSRVPELLDVVATGGREAADDARRELALLAELTRAVRRDAPEATGLSLPSAEVRLLRAVHEPNRRPVLPLTGLRQPWLFTSARAEPSLYAELRAELETADTLDLIISFIKWAGVRKLQDVLQRATAIDASGRPRLRLRVLTTTYLGATDRHAVDALATLPGVSVRVSLDGRRERLHAKAWLFGRGNGFGTAFVGSANLSKSALIDGIEWTLKIAQAREPALFESARARFEAHWADSDFQPYDPRDPRHVEALDAALRRQRMGTAPAVPVLRTWFDLQPRPFQQAMLDRLEQERAHGRTRNLLVAATGTGKTVVSAFDYLRLCQREGGRPRLLFVAHQVRILQQALDTYRQVLRDSSFGDLLDGQTSPRSHDHLFAMIQTLDRRGLVTRLGAGYWRMVVVDEAHHVPAPTFDAFMREVRPGFLLGLTATPERADGKNLGDWFDHRPDGSPACSLRLWDALNQELLCPFEYYATADGVDLRGVEWGRPGELQQLGTIIGASEVRAQAVVNALRLHLHDEGLASMKALAFCVNVDHARFISDFLNRRGLPSAALSGEDSTQLRDETVRRLESGELKVICAVNLFNEGVDIPSLNTLILLRPTQSPVVFQQQIGRGLRLHRDKDCCVVLDFIGQVAADYRFDILYRGLTGLSRRQIQQSVDQGFGLLPTGCHLQLDKVARERVLSSLRQSLDVSRQRLQRELAAWAAGRQTGEGELRLADFLREQMIERAEFYENGRSWQGLLRAIGLPTATFGPRGDQLLARVGALLHVNDPLLIAAWLRWLDGAQIPTRQILMLAHQLLHERDPVTVAGFRALLNEHPVLHAELQALLGLLDDDAIPAAQAVAGAPADWPLVLRGRYSRRQLQAAVGSSDEERRPAHREGVLLLQEKECELLFVTLDKSMGFAEAVRYADHALSPSLFHWKTQNRARPGNAAGRRYLESPGNGWRFFLFVRENRDSAFACCGQVEREAHEIPASGPIGITWRLLQPLDAGLFRSFSVLRDV